MNFLFTTVFWGAMLILLGGSIILKAVFHIDIPIFRIALALIVIYWGITLLVGKPLRFGRSRSESVIFNSQSFDSESGDEKYNVVFGSGKFNLSNIDLANGSRYVDINVVFGEGVLLIPKDIPVIIKSNAVFAEVSLPDGNGSSFGDSGYRSNNYKEGEPVLVINGKVVFGELEIREK